MAFRLAPLTATFSDRLLAADLPDLDAERRREVVAFVGRRVERLAGPTKLGVAVVALVVAAAGRVLGADRVARTLGRVSLPLVGEYPRLVRSLGYAYVWETWPDTTARGGLGPADPAATASTADPAATASTADPAATASTAETPDTVVPG